jgi:hypothetical protein
MVEKDMMCITSFGYDLGAKTLKSHHAFTIPSINHDI